MSSEDEDHEEVRRTSKKSRAEQLLEQELIKKWTSEQLEARTRLKLFDTEPWQINRSVCKGDTISMTYQNEHLRYVAGMDISFVKDDDLACSGLFVFDVADNMKIVYQGTDYNF